MIHSYTPYGESTKLFKARGPEVLLSGPAGTGKSRACLEKVHLMCMINPGMRALIVRKTLTSLGSTGLVTYREHVAKEHIATGEVHFFGGSTQEPPCYRYKNGSVIVIGGMDKATKIMSSEYDLVYVQEAIELTEDDWESITTRLRNGRVSFQQIIADTNPSLPTHWLKQRGDKGKTFFINTKHEDNPVYFNQTTGEITPLGQAYLDKLSELTGVRLQRYRYGNWVAAEGLVYEDYEPEIHAIEPFDIPDDWTRYLSIDFGFRNPFVCQWWAEDYDGRLYLYKEIYQTNKIIEDHAKTIKDNLGPGKFAAVICDHDLEDRMTLERHLGMGTVPAKKTVSDGIQAVSSRLRIQTDAKPRLFFFKNAVIDIDQSLVDGKKPVSTLQELAGYVWKPGKDEPLKENDHGMDATRYMVAYNDLYSGGGDFKWL